MKKIFLLGFFSLLLIQCRLESPTQGGKTKYQIVATTGIIADGIEAIVKDSAYVEYIMGPGTDPHIYKPTALDVELLDKADIIVANGLHLEGKMAEMLEKYSEEKTVFFLADGIAENKLLNVADIAGAIDPHIWFDPTLWSQGLKYVTEELGKKDTSRALFYNKNYDAYNTEIEEMDAWIKREFNKLSESQKVLITSHDAFHYFGRRYGIEVKGIQGISTLSEVGLRDITNTVDFIVERGIKAIFTETSTSEQTAKSIRDGVTARGQEIKILGPLFADALGEPDSKAGTYLGMIRENVALIIGGLSEQ